MHEVLEEDEAEFNRERSAVIGVACTSSMAKSVKSKETTMAAF
jgi:hypothetical protein